MLEIEISQMGKNNGNPDLVCEKSLSHIPVPALGKDKERTATRRLHDSRTSIRDVTEMLK